MRLSFDDYFMEFAILASRRSTCASRQVGAVIVRDKHIISTGYNGSPPGVEHCTQVGCKILDGRCIKSIHAEQNAILQAALHGVSTRGATLYCTWRPCSVCANMVAGSGIVRVVYIDGEMDGWSKEVFDACEIKYECYEKKAPQVDEV